MLPPATLPPKGRAHARGLVEALANGTASILKLARQTLLLIASMLTGLCQQIRAIELELMAWHCATATRRRLEAIPGIGFIAATVWDARLPLGPSIRRVAWARTQAVFFRYTRRKATTVSVWVDRLLERKPARLIGVAVSIKPAAGHGSRRLRELTFTLSAGNLVEWHVLHTQIGRNFAGVRQIIDQQV